MSNPSKRPVEIIAYHGWGMSARFWNKWDDLLGDHITFKKNDRGYFSNPVLHRFEEKEAIHVLFVEGFGMHWVPAEEWRKAHLIVLFSAFKNLKDIMKKSRKVDQVVSTLQNKVREEVYRTLDLFRKEMFKGSGDDFMEQAHLGNADRELLIRDLQQYYNDIVDTVPVNEKAKVILYESQYDSISVHPQKKIIKDLFGALHHYRRFEMVGHAFPFSHAMECYEDLSTTVKIF